MAHYLSQSWLIDRRHALRAMGSCISLPFLECMVPLHAEEPAAATPKRSAFIYLANGTHSLNYQITTPGSDYQFSRTLKPLEKYREVITPISGMHHPGALAHHHGCRDRHVAFDPAARRCAPPPRRLFFDFILSS